MAATPLASNPAGCGHGPTAVAAYYRAAAVRSRLAEYCGGRPDDLGSLGAMSLAGYGGARGLMEADGAPVTAPLGEWEGLLEEGADVCRSLADRVGTLLVLDVDYANHDDPGEPYRDPERTFRRLEPVYRAVRDAFAGMGVHPLVLMTGRGYHFVVKAVSGTPFHGALVTLGNLGASLQSRYERSASEAGSLPVESGRAHEGAGRMLEFLAHEVMRTVEGRAEVPITLIDMSPGGGGPFVCLDLTAYADPLFARNTRCAFSSNQKPAMKGLGVHPAPLFVLPRRDEAVPDLLRARQDPRRAAELAVTADVRIPVALGGAEWVSAYRASALARFHHYVDTGPEVDPESWPATYDALDLRTVPACAAWPLSQPNPALLTPGWLRTVSLALWAQGWHPRSIAALVRSRFMRPHGWGSYWKRYDAESRARFYVRAACGALAAGIEPRSAFNCQAQRERGLCTAGHCGFDLAGLWDAPRPTWGGER